MLVFVRLLYTSLCSPTNSRGKDTIDLGPAGMFLHFILVFGTPGVGLHRLGRMHPLPGQTQGLQNPQGGPWGPLGRSNRAKLAHATQPVLILVE
jgi:hypothetical protein